MKLLFILFSAFVVASLFGAGLARSQPARPSQAVSAAYRQAMDKCQEMYGGRWMSHQRFLNVEMCFKNLTGQYPAQVNVNCTACNCTRLMPCTRFESRCHSGSNGVC
jgi:hypothetical protein